MTTEERQAEQTLLRLNARAWGIATGLLFGGGLFVATNVLVLKGGIRSVPTSGCCPSTSRATG